MMHHNGAHMHRLGVGHTARSRSQCVQPACAAWKQVVGQLSGSVDSLSRKQ